MKGHDYKNLLETVPAPNSFSFWGVGCRRVGTEVYTAGSSTY